MARPTQTESAALLAHAGREGHWFRAKEDIVKGYLRPHVADDARIVVLGVGNGATVARLRRLARRCAIEGLDVDQAALELCATRDPRGTYRLADLETDPIGHPDSADVVVALNVLEHLQDDPGVVGRIAACLRPGGVLVVNVPAHPWLFGDHDVRLGHLRRYRPGEIEAHVRAAGLKVAHATPLFMTTLLLLMVWRKLVQGWLGVKPRRSDVSLALPAPLDAGLYLVARLEGWVSHARLPFGSSHLVVARKPPGGP
jgi:SAM-dependent methyltransferase